MNGPQTPRKSAAPASIARTSAVRSAVSAVESLETRRLFASPSIDAIAAYTVPVGKTVQVPIAVTYDQADQLSFTSSDNSAAIVTQFRSSANTFIEMKVEGYAQPMVFQLFDDLAPQTVRRIKGLVNSGFYDGLTFHRVLNNFVIQGGDPAGDGSGGPGFSFDDEFNAAATFTGDGQLAMANSGKDTNGSQFFVTEGAQRFLDFNHTVFGQLVRGFSTRNAISDLPVDGSSRPNSVVRITSVKIIADKTDAVLMVKLNSLSSGTVTVTAVGAGGSSSRSFAINGVNDATNDPPYLRELSPVYYTPVNTPVQIPLKSVDPEGNAVVYNGQFISQAGATGQLNQETGVLTVTPKAGYTGPVTIYAGVGVPNATSRGSSQQDNNQPLGGIFDVQKITVAVGDLPITARGNNFIATSGAPVNDVIVASFTDADRAGLAAGYTAKVNWGDGTITNGVISKNSRGTFYVTGTHAYAGNAVDASYPIDVDITSPAGALSHTESYAVVSPFASTRAGVLRISGTSSADRIGVSRKGSTYYVTVNRQTRTFPSSDVRSIQAYTFDGDDLIQLSDDVRVPTYLEAGLGNDVIYGGGGDDVINAGDGRDTVYTGAGSNRVAGAEGNDSLFGDIGRDRLFGGDGNDFISGGSGRDILSGDNGNDTLVGGASNDTLYGGVGDDILNGNNGADYIDGGTGRDQTKTDSRDTRIAVEVLV